MPNLTRPLHRLTLTTVGVCLMLCATALPALAAPAADEQISILSQSSGLAALRGVHLTASVTHPASRAIHVVAVRFSFRSSPSGAPTEISTVTTTSYRQELAEFSTAWTPPAVGSYTELAEALDEYSQVLSSTAKVVTVTSTAPSVQAYSANHQLLYPPFGLSPNGTVRVIGHRSADLPTVVVSVQARDNSTGVIGPASKATTIGAAQLDRQDPQLWTADVLAPACSNLELSGCTYVVTATASNGNETTDFVALGVAYFQEARHLQFWTAHPTSATGLTVPLTVLAQDEYAQPVPGAPVRLSSSSAELRIAETTLTMDATGQASTTARTAARGVVTIYATAIDGWGGHAGFNIDFKAPVPTRLEFPNYLDGTIFAIRSASTPTMTDAYDGRLEVCPLGTDGNSAERVHGADLVVTRTRSTRTGSVTTTAAPVPVALAVSGLQRDCYLMAAPPGGREDSGSDTFRVRSSATSPLAFATTTYTMRYAALVVTAPNVRGYPNTDVPVVVTYRTPDGRGFAGEHLSLTIKGGWFSDTQRPGVVRLNPSAASCVLNAVGACSVNTRGNGAGGSAIVAISDQPHDVAQGDNSPVVIHATTDVIVTFGNWVTITSPLVVHPMYGLPLTIVGMAAPNSNVLMHVHWAGMKPGDYSITQTASVGSDGVWGASIPATSDFRYFASAVTDTSSVSAVGLAQPEPRLFGLTPRTVARGSRAVIGGSAIPGSTVFVHFRTPDMAPGVGVVRSVLTNAKGGWNWAFDATSDYLFFFTRRAADPADPNRACLVWAR